MLAATGVLRGLQDTRTPLAVAVVGNAANVALNLALVYGAGLGIAGSAWGSVLAQVGSAAALAYVVVNAARRHHAVGGALGHRGRPGQVPSPGVGRGRGAGGGGVAG